MVPNSPVPPWTSGIEGLHHVAQETDGCLIRYDMEGTRTDCSGCDYAFEVVLEVNFNDCGGSASTLTSRFEFNRDRLYICLLYTSPSPRD